MSLDTAQLETRCVTATSFANLTAVRRAYANYLETRPAHPVTYEQYLEVVASAVTAGA